MVLNIQRGSFVTVAYFIDPGIQVFLTFFLNIKVNSSVVFDSLAVTRQTVSKQLARIKIMFFLNANTYDRVVNLNILL